MGPADRLQARSLLLDEVFVQKSQLEHSLTQERKRAEEAEARVKELEAENAVLRGEPKP
jgi:cell division protein FtsB